MKKKILLTISTVLVLLFTIILIFVLNFALSNKEYYKHEKNISIPIFVYHEIVKQKTAEDFMQTTDTVFKKQICGLLKLGYEFITYDDLIAYNNGEKKLKNKVVLVTFDDGFISNYEILFPIIKELQVPITINVINSNVGTPNYMSWSQLKQMYDSGLVKIHSHGKLHIESFKIKKGKFVKDILMAHHNIEKHLGKKIAKVFTYPYGIYEEKKLRALEKEGFVQNLTDNKINESKTLNMSRLHREYPLSDSVFMILLKILYREIRYPY